MKEGDKTTYELIAEEIDTGNTQKALWTKAFSDAEGDDKRARALYIKYRFEEISNEEQEYLENKSIGGTSSPKNSMGTSELAEKSVIETENYRFVKKGDKFYLDPAEESVNNFENSQEYSDRGTSFPKNSKETPKIDGFLAVVGFFLVIICIFFGFFSFMQFTSSSHDNQILVLHGVLFYKRADLFYEYVEMYQWRLFGEFLLMLFLTFKFFKKSKDFVAIYFMGIFLNILVAYSFHYQLVLEKYSNANLEYFIVVNGLANIPTIVYITLFIYFKFSSKVKQTFVN